jgi:hypothetical protein
MAAFNYEEIRDVADEIISDFGRAGALRRKAGTGTATRACVVVEVDYRPTERDGQIVQFTDRRFLCAAGRGGALGQPPDSEEDKLVLDGKEMRIVTAKRIQPASTCVVYDLQVRL